VGREERLNSMGMPPPRLNAREECQRADATREIDVRSAYMEMESVDCAAPD